MGTSWPLRPRRALGGLLNGRVVRRVAEHFVHFYLPHVLSGNFGLSAQTSDEIRRIIRESATSLGAGPECVGTGQIDCRQALSLL